MAPANFSTYPTKKSEKNQPRKSNSDWMRPKAREIGRIFFYSSDESFTLEHADTAKQSAQSEAARSMALKTIMA